MNFQIGCNRYEIMETETEYIYTLVDTDLNKIIVKGNLRECIEKAKGIMEKDLYNAFN